MQGSLLSRLDFSEFSPSLIECLLTTYYTATSPPESGVSLSPPFVLSTAVSSTGIVAAGLADGRVWIGIGGEKRPAAPGSGGKQKRSRKWEGLKENEGLSAKVAEGPVVGLCVVYIIVAPSFHS